jgi:WD40 repeat protein
MICAFGKTIQAWNPRYGQLIADLKEHCESITSIAIAPNGKHLASMSKDGAVRVWDLKTFAFQEQRVGHKAWPRAIGFARDGSFMVTGTPAPGPKDTAEFQIWDLNPLKRRRSLTVRGIRIPKYRIQVSANGEVVILPKAVRDIRIPSPEPQDAPEDLFCGYESDQIQISANGKFLVCGDSIVALDSGRRFRSRTSNFLRLHQIDGKELLLEPTEHGIVVSDVTGLVTSTTDFHAPYLVAKGTVAEDVAPAKQEFSDYMGAYTILGRPAEVPPWEMLALALEVPGYERDEKASNLLCNLAQAAPRRRLWRAWPWHVLIEHTARVRALALDAGGRLAISCGDDNTLRLWDVKSATCRAVFSGHSASVADVCIGRDGRLAASASEDGTVRIWDLYEGKCRWKCVGHSAGVTSVRLTSDGQHLVSGAWDGTVRIWDTLSGKCLSVISVALYHSENLVQCVDIDGDGNIALCVTDSPVRKTAQVRNLNTGELLGELVVRRPHSAQLSTRGRLALTTSHDSEDYHGELAVWDMEAFHCSQMIPEDCERGRSFPRRDSNSPPGNVSVRVDEPPRMALGLPNPPPLDGDNSITLKSSTGIGGGQSSVQMEIGFLARVAIGSKFLE